MLDIRGTLDGMTPEKVKYFFALLDNVRLFYNASTIKLFFSSFDKNPDGIREYFNIMKDYIPNTMEIGNSFYRYGNYDCLNNKEEFISDTYNYDKDALLEENYIDDSVKWFGIFDDKQDSSIEYIFPNSIISFVVSGLSIISQFSSSRNVFHSTLYL